MLTVVIEGRITVNNSDEMRRKLLAALGSRPSQITVDLSRAAYMDSSGLATLLESVRIRAEATHPTRACGTHLRQPRNLFEVGQLDRLFEFAPQEPSA